MSAFSVSKLISRRALNTAIYAACALPSLTTLASAQMQTAISSTVPAESSVPMTTTAPQTDSSPMIESPSPAATPQPLRDETEKPKQKRFQFGPEAGLFLPTSRLAKNSFGSSKFSLGLGITPIRDADDKGKFGLDLKLFYLKRGANRAIFVPAGVDYRRAFARTATITPYAGASANLYPTNLRVPALGIDSDLKLGYGGSVFTGLVWKHKGYLEARYMGVSRIQGFNLSGFNFSAGFRF